MTLASDNRVTAEYTADGTQIQFTYDFPIFFSDESKGLQVRFVNSTGFDIVDTGDYIVVQNTENTGGYIQFGTAPTSGKIVQIVGNTPIDQQLEIANQSRFDPESIETNFDKIVAILQEWFQRLSDEEKMRIANDLALKNRIDATDLNLATEIANRIKGDENLQTQISSNKLSINDLKNIVSESINNGTSPNLAVFAVNSISDLDSLKTWENRTVYVKDIGIYRYSLSTNSWIPDLINQNQELKVNTLSDLKDTPVWDFRLVTVLSRFGNISDNFAGKFIYLDSSKLAENGGTIFTSNIGSGRWFRLYSGDVNALWFGVSDGINDQNILNTAIQCAVDNKRAIDISGSVWGISSEVKMHNAVTVKSGLENKITVKQGTYTNGYAIEVGDPSQGWMGGRSTLTCNGALWIECQSRDFKLKGFYIKGSFHKIDGIRAVGFNGTGCRLDAFHDSQVGRISVELCGNEEEYAFDCSSTDDTCNAFSIESLQVEQAYQRGIKFTETIRATVNNIHSERLITTNKNPTNDNPLGYDLNHIFNTANSTFNQAILDSTDTDLYARIDGAVCTYTNFYVDQGNVYGSFGNNTTYIDLFAKSFLQYGTYKNISFIDPNIPTMTLTDTATVHNPSVTDMIFGYQAKNINIFGGSITNYGGSTTSDVAMGNINACGTEIGNVYKTGNGDGYCSGLSNCKITNFYGNWDNIVKVVGGTIQNAELSTRSMAVFNGVTFKDFKANGDFKYITRNCTATGTVAWSVPTALTTQLGTLTERIGYSVDGKIYQYDGKAWSKLV